MSEYFALAGTMILHTVIVIAVLGLLLLLYALALVFVDRFRQNPYRKPVRYLMAEPTPDDGVAVFDSSCGRVIARMTVESAKDLRRSLKEAIVVSELPTDHASP